MIEWDDRGILLDVRPHGERSAVISVFSQHHGRHHGMVVAGQTRRWRPILQPGNLLHLRWKGRLPDQLGQFSVECDRPYAAQVLYSPGPLRALTSLCSVCRTVLPEQTPFPALYQASLAFLDALSSPIWPTLYVHWELALLRDLGFGLDLSACAAGGNDQLAYVSPKTGRAVSLSAGQPYADKLFTLPQFLLSGYEGTSHEIQQALRLTGYFLRRHALKESQSDLPAARERLLDSFDTRNSAMPTAF